MRRALLSVVVGLAGAACVTASGWALQAAALPPPTSADRVAADASAWFHEYRVVVDTFHFDHRRTNGLCLRGWFGRVRGQKARASLLSLASGPVYRAVKGQPVARVKGHADRRLPGQLAAAAGCSDELAPVLAAAAQSGGHLTVSRGYAANRPAIALKVSRGKEERFTIYVAPETYRPLVVIVDMDGREVSSRLFLSRVKRQLLVRFHLLPDVLRAPRS